MSSRRLAPTPPMGWNTWDCYGASITEDEFRACSDYVARHLLPFGWDYVVVDIQWYQEDAPQSFYPETDDLVMDGHGRLLPAPGRFPSCTDGRGFGPLADYVHSLGLKFGVHFMRGIPRPAVKRNLPILGADATAADIADQDDDCIWCKNCWGVDTSRPGAQAYYDSVVALYASWGVDYIKVDDMSRPYHTGEIEALRAAVDKCGRDVVVSLSPGNTPIDQAEHVKEHAELWRSSNDLWDVWGGDKDGYAGLTGAFALCAAWASHAGPGHWPDPDMLPLGHLCLHDQHGPQRDCRLTSDEQYTMMTLWFISRSPLMFGGDPLSMDDFTLSLLTNAEALAVNQSGTNAREVSRADDAIVWASDVPDSADRYVALFNIGDAGAAEIRADLAELGLTGPCTVRDLWLREDAGTARGTFAATVAEHGAGLFRISPTP